MTAWAPCAVTARPPSVRRVTIYFFCSHSVVAVFYISQVFVDELDGVGSKRGMGYNDERDQTLNQLLTELDGFDGRPGGFWVTGCVCIWVTWYTRLVASLPAAHRAARV